EMKLNNRMNRVASSRLTQLLNIATLSPELDHDIRSLFVQVWVNLPVTILIHHFDQVHKVPLRDDMLAGNNSPVLIRLASRKHTQHLIILMLVDAAIKHTNPFDARRVPHLRSDCKRLEHRGAGHRLMRNGRRLVVIRYYHSNGLSLTIIWVSRSPSNLINSFDV